MGFRNTTFINAAKTTPAIKLWPYTQTAYKQMDHWLNFATHQRHLRGDQEAFLTAHISRLAYDLNMKFGTP